MQKNIIDLIFDTIDDYNKELSDELQLGKSHQTALFGQGSMLDSLGLINLIVAIEQKLEDELDVSITLADEKAMSQKVNPFITVGSLVNYIEMQLEENESD